MVLLFLGILGGIWLNRRDFADLKADMNRQFSDVNHCIDRVENDLKADMSRQFNEVNRRLDRADDDLKVFHSVTGKLDGRIDEIKARL